jgi:hypothetical protein
MAIYKKEKRLNLKNMGGCFGGPEASLGVWKSLNRGIAMLR